jgi:hypothetical protein
MVQTLFFLLLQAQVAAVLDTMGRRAVMAVLAAAEVAELQQKQVEQETHPLLLHHKEVMVVLALYQLRGLAVAVAVQVQSELMALVATQQPVELAVLAQHPL